MQKSLAPLKFAEEKISCELEYISEMGQKRNECISI